MRGINRAVDALNEITVEISTALTDRVSGALTELYRGRTSARVRSGVNVVGGVDRRHALNSLAAKDAFRDPAMAAAGLNARMPPSSVSSSDFDFDWFGPSSTTRINREIDDCLGRLNPRWVDGDPRWRYNCVSVATAYELRRRGFNVTAGQVSEKLMAVYEKLRQQYVDAGKNPAEVPLGFYGLNTILAWGQRLFETDMTGLFHAFREPGSRGIIVVELDTGGRHQLNVEHVPGAGLRFVDGQPNPPLTDASSMVKRAKEIWYMRLDNVKEIPPQSILDDLGIRFLDSAGRP